MSPFHSFSILVICNILWITENYIFHYDYYSSNGKEQISTVLNNSEHLNLKTFSQLDCIICMINETELKNSGFSLKPWSTRV